MKETEDRKVGEEENLLNLILRPTPDTMTAILTKEGTKENTHHLKVGKKIPNIV